MQEERTERKYMLWVCPDCAVERRGDGECGGCGKTNCVVPVTVVPEQQLRRPVVPCDDAAVERAEASVEDILRPYASVLSAEILAEQIVEAVLRAAGEA